MAIVDAIDALLGVLGLFVGFLCLMVQEGCRTTDAGKSEDDTPQRKPVPKGTNARPTTAPVPTFMTDEKTPVVYLGDTIEVPGLMATAAPLAAHTLAMAPSVAAEPPRQARAFTIKPPSALVTSKGWQLHSGAGEEFMDPAPADLELWGVVIARKEEIITEKELRRRFQEAIEANPRIKRGLTSDRIERKRLECLRKYVLWEPTPEDSEPTHDWTHPGEVNKPPPCRVEQRSAAAPRATLSRGPLTREVAILLFSNGEISLEEFEASLPPGTFGDLSTLEDTLYNDVKATMARRQAERLATKAEVVGEPDRESRIDLANDIPKPRGGGQGTGE